MADQVIGRPRHEHRESARVCDNGDPLQHKVTLTRKDPVPPSSTITSSRKDPAQLGSTPTSIPVNIGEKESTNTSQTEDEDIPKAKSSRASSTKSINLVSDEEGDTEEDDDGLIGRLRNKWTASVYAFFHPEPEIEWQGVKGTNDRKKYLKFKCVAPHCHSAGRHGPYVYRALEGSDSTSTKNLRHHAEVCYGKEALAAADGVQSVEKRREIITGRNNDLRDGSLALAFEKQGPWQQRYSARPPTKAESKAYHVRWAAESKRPFEIVNDPGYQRNMKEGRPHHYVPSSFTLRRDLKKVFASSCQQVSQLLRAHPGHLHFGTDCWTLPNHRPFIAVTVHYEKDGEVVTWLLDIVEMSHSHSGRNLAETFTSIICEYGLEKKMLACVCDNATSNDVMVESFHQFLPSAPRGQPNRVRCFCHIINLVSRTILSLFDIPQKKNHEEITVFRKRMGTGLSTKASKMPKTLSGTALQAQGLDDDEESLDEL